MLASIITLYSERQHWHSQIYPFAVCPCALCVCVCVCVLNAKASWLKLTSISGVCTVSCMHVACRFTCELTNWH